MAMSNAERERVAQAVNQVRTARTTLGRANRESRELLTEALYALRTDRPHVAEESIERAIRKLALAYDQTMASV